MKKFTKGILAGLCADGVTTVKNTKFIDRGYEDFENNLSMLNADVRRKAN